MDIIDIIKSFAAKPTNYYDDTSLVGTWCKNNNCCTSEYPAPFTTWNTHTHHALSLHCIFIFIFLRTSQTKQEPVPLTDCWFCFWYIYIICVSCLVKYRKLLVNNLMWTLFVLWGFIFSVWEHPMFSEPLFADQYIMIFNPLCSCDQRFLSELTL